MTKAGIGVGVALWFSVMALTMDPEHYLKMHRAFSAGAARLCARREARPEPDALQNGVSDGAVTEIKCIAKDGSILTMALQLPQ